MNISTQILKDGDDGVVQTLELMRKYVNEYVNNSSIREIVTKLTIQGSCDNKIRTIKNIFTYIIKNIKYTPDPQNIELVKSAKHTILGDMKYGDCDDLSVALATLLKAYGLNVWFRAVAWKKEAGNNFTHVYVILELPCGKYVMALDPSMSNKGFGNEVRYFRKMDMRI